MLRGWRFGGGSWIRLCKVKESVGRHARDFVISDYHCFEVICCSFTLVLFFLCNLVRLARL